MNAETIQWNLLLQIPLAGVVVLVVILFLRHLKDVTGEFASTVKDLTNQFMTAIKEQREQNIASLNNIMKTVDELDRNITNRLEEMAVVRAKLAAAKKAEMR